MTINRKISSKKIIIYSILIVLMVAGNIIIYFRNSHLDQSTDMMLSEFSAETEMADLPVEHNKKIVKQSKQIKSIVENNLFITLQKIGDWPIHPKNVGKSDPFAPFFKQLK